MRWPQPYRMPKWILSAAAMGMLAAPTITLGQSGTSAATGKPTIKPVVRPAGSKSSVRTAAPTVPPMEESPEAFVTPVAQTTTAPAVTTVENETPVQKELRRLYYENGREMPQVPTPAQLQSINGRASAQPLAPVPAPLPAYGTNVAVPPRGGAAPAASAPVRTSRNPITAFFQRITPGSKPQPVPAPAAVTQPVPQAPQVAQQASPPPPPRNYAPYSGTQPKRLNEQPARPAAIATTTPPTAATPATTAVPIAPVVTAPKTPIVTAPTTNVNVAEKLQLEAAPVSTTSQPVAARVVTAPTTGPVITGPSTTKSFTARSTPEPEPVFEEPVIVDSNAVEESPFEEPVVAQPIAEQQSIAAAESGAEGDFPEPFPESKTDDEAMESPFSGLALDEEEPIVAKPIPIEAAPLADSAAEPLPLTVPATENPVIAAPATAAIEPEPTAQAAPAAALPVEDDEFFPADVAKPAEIVQSGNEPVLALPGAPMVAKPATPAAADSPEYAAKMQKIKDRGGMKGLKGFCPVTLRDERELKDAKPEIHSQFRGQKFHFASAEAKAKFDQAPAGYAPAAYGADVVVLIRDKDVAEGTLDYAAWFKGQLYLFSSEETHAVFTADPAKFAAPAGLE